MPNKRKRLRAVGFHKAELVIFRSLCLILLILAAAKIIKAEIKGLFEPKPPATLEKGPDLP